MTSTILPCPWCGHINPPNAMLCDACDQPVQVVEIGLARQTPAPRMDAELKSIVVLAVINILVVTFVVACLV
jgi:hypothetical protein